MKSIQSSCGADVIQPHHFDFFKWKSGAIVPSPLFEWDALPIQSLCQLAHIWQEVGFQEKAGQLAHFLDKIRPFPTFWCKESEFDPNQILENYSLLEGIERKEGDDFGTTSFQTDVMQACLTDRGMGTSLGVIAMHEIKIQAFGPQTLSLSRPECFGIRGRLSNGWIPIFANPAVWLYHQIHLNSAGAKLHVQFIGKEIHEPLFFTFYIQAKMAQIGSKCFTTKSLDRFVGRETQWNIGGVQFELSQSHTIHLILLAGSGCFWDADFLVAIEMDPLEAQFQLNWVAK